MSYSEFRWAGGAVARKYGDEHFLVVGASGSGKTTIMNRLMESVLSDPSTRAIVYDPKQEIVPFLYGIRGFENVEDSLRSSVRILHPFDYRSVSWDMAADIDDPIGARQLATILVPESENEGTNAFFSSAVRDILTAVILTFVECVSEPRSWTFRDVLLAMLYTPYFEALAELTETRDGRPFPILKRVRDCYLGEDTDGKTKANVRASIHSKLAIFEPVAAAWFHATGSLGGSFSFRKWLAESPTAKSPGSILVLGNDEAARAALDPINKAMFKRAVELVLARRERTAEERESGTNQIWFFLDELREAGELDGLGRLLTKGRSKNACVAMGFQDVDGLRDVYGKEAANEICAQFNNIAVLRLNSPETAQWASELFGKRLDSTQNSSTGLSTGTGSGLTLNQGKSETERYFLYPDAFLYGTNAAAAKAVRGYRKGPDQDLASLSRELAIEELRFDEKNQAKRTQKEELIAMVKKISPATPEVSSLVSEHWPRPGYQQYMDQWNAVDGKRLFGARGIPEPSGSPSQKPSLSQRLLDRANRLEENE